MAIETVCHVRNHANMCLFQFVIVCTVSRAFGILFLPMNLREGGFERRLLGLVIAL